MLIALRDMRSCVRAKHETTASATHALSRGQIGKRHDVLPGGS
jgi:hypothetical protein